VEGRAAREPGWDGPRILVAQSVEGVLRAMLAWLAVLAVVTTAALAAGGEHRPRRLVLASVLLAATLSALARRRTVAETLRRRPRLILAATALLACTLVLDGGERVTVFAGLGAPLVGMAAVAGSRAAVATCASIVLVGAIGSVALSQGPAGLLSDQAVVDLAANAAALLAFSTALGLLFGAFAATLRGAERIVAEARGVAASYGAEPSPPALAGGAAGALGRADPRALVARLTAAERHVLDLLMTGMSVKQIARERGTTIATVRAQVRAAKRKTGARTLAELGALGAAARDRAPEVPIR